MNSEISFPLFGEGFVINPPGYISLFGFDLYLYGLFITLGFVLAGLYIYKRRDMLGLTQDNVMDMIILAAPCGIIGARIYYALFNFSDYFGPGNWLNIFMLRRGGLAVYGGVIGGGIAFYVYSRVKKVPVGRLLDAAGFGLFIGQAAGRWGNFFNREAFGIATDMPWRMGLISRSGASYVHPTFLYESLWNIVGLVLMHIYSKKRKKGYPGQYFLLYVAWYGFGRYMIEVLRTDSLFISGTDIRISQLIAALSFSVAAFLLLRYRLCGAAGIEVSDIKDESDTLIPADGPPIDFSGEDAEKTTGGETGKLDGGDAEGLDDAADAEGNYDAGAEALDDADAEGLDDVDAEDDDDADAGGLDDADAGGANDVETEDSVDADAGDNDSDEIEEMTEDDQS